MANVPELVGGTAGTQFRAGLGLSSYGLTASGWLMELASLGPSEASTNPGL